MPERRQRPLPPAQDNTQRSGAKIPIDCIKRVGRSVLYARRPPARVGITAIRAGLLRTLRNRERTN